MGNHLRSERTGRPVHSREGPGSLHDVPLEAHSHQRGGLVPALRALQGVPDDPGAAATPAEERDRARRQRQQPSGQMDCKWHRFYSIISRCLLDKSPTVGVLLPFQGSVPQREKTEPLYNPSSVSVGR